MSLRAPSMSAVAKVVGRLSERREHDSKLVMEKTKATNRRWSGTKDGDLSPRHSSFSPWLHENTAKVDLSVKVDVQHLLQVVLETHTSTDPPLVMQTVQIIKWKRSCIPVISQEHQRQLAFSPIDTPPEVMITSARLIPSWSADSKSSGLNTHHLDISKHSRRFTNSLWKVHEAIIIILPLIYN